MLLREAGISVVEAMVAHTAREAIAAATAMGFPVVLKPITRRSANGASPLLVSKAEVRNAFRELVAETEVEGVSVKRAPRPGVELMVAVEQDPLFGPVLAFGFGKMAVDVWEDVAYRIVPLYEKDARLMIREPKAQRLLQGYGNLEAPQASLVEEMLLRASRLVEDNPEIWRLELSPAYAYRDQVVVMDATVELRELNAAEPEPHQEGAGLKIVNHPDRTVE